MSIIYHHYGAVLIAQSLDQLWDDQRASLIAPQHLLRHLDPLTVGLADSSAPTFQIVIRWGAAATLEAVVDRSAGTQTLTYRTDGAAPEIAEYVATCTVQRVADEPSKTVVEWTRRYRPAMDADPDRSNAVVAKLLDQDQALAARFMAAYDGAEVLLIDYTLGGAAVERRANQTASRGTRYAQAA